MPKEVKEYFLVIIVILFMSSIYVFFISESKVSTKCFAKEGILNLENWNWTEKRRIQLNGQWKRYNELLKEDIQAETPFDFKEVPDYWEQDKERNYSSKGTATYKMIVKGLTPLELYGLDLPYQATAYALFANNKKAAANGVVSKDAKSYIPQWRPMVTIIQADENGEIELVMEVSNFKYHKGGFWDGIRMGKVQDILTNASKGKIREMFFFTSLFIIGLLSFGLFVIHSTDKAPLYFSFFCISMSFQLLLSGRRLFPDMITKLNWEVLVRVEYLSGYLLVPLISIFLMYLLQVKTYFKLKRFFFMIFILCCLVITLGMPLWVCAAFMEPYKWIGVLLSGYFLYLGIVAVRKGELGVKLIILAVLGLLFAMLQRTFFNGAPSWLSFSALNVVICFLIIMFEQFLTLIRRNEILETKVVMDPLTGLYNRNYLAQLNRKYINKEKKYVLFLDLDYFKHINDNFGHKAGDFILLETGKRLRSLLTSTGTICRYGGDEFIIIIHNEEVEEVKNIAERIVVALQQPFEKEGHSYQIGVSIGIAESNENTKSMEELLKLSDEAMYRAKKNGRNQYCYYKAAAAAEEEEEEEGSIK